MRKLHAVAAFCFLLLSGAASQEVPIKFGKVNAADFEVKAPFADSGTAAIIVADIGNTGFTGNDKGWVSYMYKRKKRIKILDKKAFDLATIQIMLYRDGENVEKLTDISAVTYNLENNRIKETKLEKKDILEEKIDRNHIVKKFAMPAVVAGSIIEYSYTIRSDFEFLLPAWRFQDYSYPTLWSEYSLNIPSLLTYKVRGQIKNKFFINDLSEGRENYSISRQASTGTYTTTEEKLNVTATTVKQRWVMKDIPAFGNESYISTPENYIDKLNFQLFQIFDGQDTKPVSNTWEQLTSELLKREDFGKPIEERDFWIAELAKQVTVNKTDKLQQAKSIYAHVRDNMTCTDQYNKYIRTTLKDAYRQKSGTVGEINLLLTALLRESGITAYPVLLSTREHGRTVEQYPMLEKLNYVLCKAEIEGKDYYLDASLPYLGFNKVPLSCYNGAARVLGSLQPNVQFSADAVQEGSNVILSIKNAENGGMSGSYYKNPGYYHSADIRQKIRSSSQEAYAKQISDRYGKDATIKDVTLDSLQSYDAPVIIKYNMQLNALNGEDIIYFNPLQNEFFAKNPFAAETRSYPVELPYPINESFVLNMEIPKGYTVDELPQMVRYNLNNNLGTYEYLVSNINGTVQVRRTLKLTKATFGADDYTTLREFFANTIKKDNEQIVFKKAR